MSEFTNNNIESETTPESEPSIQELAEACADVLDPEVCDEISQISDFEEALGLAYSLLLEAGKDPDAFLTEKNILAKEDQ